MQLSVRKARNVSQAAHSRTGARPLMPHSAGRLGINSAYKPGVCRFKEDDSVIAEIERRRHQEELIRKQEELISMLSQPVEEEAPTAPAPAPAPQELKKKLLQMPQRLDMVSYIISHIHKGYDPDAFRCNPLVPAFTRRREAIVGRIAMLGFAGACIGEIVTPSHAGIIGQIQLWSGLDKTAVVAAVAALAAFNIIGGLNPWSPTWSRDNIKDLAKRPPGPPTQLPQPLTLRSLLGMSEHWGFTKRNELFHSRLAMMGFLGTFIGEMATGRGPLAQLAVWLNLVPTDEYYHAVPYVFGLFVTLVVTASLADGTIRAAQKADMEYDQF